MILLLNDTSRYHNGCAEVVRNIGFDKSVSSLLKSDPVPKIDFTDVDLVVLNGEGTMHHDQSTAVIWINILEQAQKLGIETQLINSVWQKMSQRHADVIKQCTIVEVREVLSHQELLRQGVMSTIVPDRSIRSYVPHEFKEHVQVYKGQPFHDKPIQGDYPQINIFNESWNDIVNKLRNCDLLITGRHHEMYAAIKAQCRFIILPGNSWKNEGLLETCSDLPILDLTVDDVLSGKYDLDYEKIFKWATQ